MCRRVKQLLFGKSRCALLKPYVLSFTTLDSFETIWVYAKDEDDRIGIGEAVALPGYSWETTDSIFATVASIVENASDLTYDKLIERCRTKRCEHPFATSAVMTALEMPLWLEHLSHKACFPLNYPVSSELSPEILKNAIQTGLRAGYHYIKVKIGRDLTKDLETAEHMLMGRFYPHSIPIVFDANQAYTLEEALEFAHFLEKYTTSHTFWFEQPIAWNDWKSLKILCHSTKTPIVLDESIYTAHDIKKAHAIGAYGVKLKIFKNFGLTETLALARQARALDMAVVFGNGVATDIGNFAEYLVLSAGIQTFSSPAECNGFLKIKTPLIFNSLFIDDKGKLCCSENMNSFTTTLTQNIDKLIQIDEQNNFSSRSRGGRR